MAHRQTPAPRARSGPGRPRSPEVDEAILVAAAELLVEGGFEGLTYDALVERVRCSKSTIYRRWPSKVQLALAALERLPDPPLPDHGSVRADLRALLRDMLEIFEDTPAVGVMQSLIGERPRNPELAAQLDAAFRRRRDTLRAALERGLARGELPGRTDLELSTDLIAGPLLTRFFCTGDPFPAGLIDPLIEAALAGAAASARGGSR